MKILIQLFSETESETMDHSTDWIIAPTDMFLTVTVILPLSVSYEIFIQTVWWDLCTNCLLRILYNLFVENFLQTVCLDFFQTVCKRKTKYEIVIRTLGIHWYCLHCILLFVQLFCTNSLYQYKHCWQTVRTTYVRQTVCFSCTIVLYYVYTAV